MAAEPKELYIVRGAGHVDLFDRVDLIPFDKLTAFLPSILNDITTAVVPAYS